MKISSVKMKEQRFKMARKIVQASEQIKEWIGDL